MSKSTEGKLLPKIEFHMYVGFCITAWAKVEEHLFDTCQSVLNTSRKNAAIIYYKTPSINARISLIDELVRAALPPPRNGEQHHPDLIRWKDINKGLTDLLKVRRQIAHQPVQVKYRIRSDNPAYADAPPGTPIPFEHVQLIPSFQLFMSVDEQLRGKSDGAKPLKTDDLSIHATQVTLLAGQIHDFRAGPLQAYLERPPQPKPLRRLARPRKKAKQK
jgi:hypothetical protein